MRRVACPYPDRFVLCRRGYVRLLEDGGGPGDVADPVGVASEFFDRGIGLLLCTANLFLARQSLEKK